jgi:hypothetical protein
MTDDGPASDTPTGAPLVRDARVLLERVVEAMAQRKDRRNRGQQPIQQSREHVTWSDTLFGQSVRVRDELHDTVAALARSQRAEGVPPERMVTLLKDLIHDAHADALEWHEARALNDDVVRWGIEAYYAA